MSASHSYAPVDCDFHDRLEALATTRRRVHITSRGADGGAQESSEGVIVDIYTTPSKEEFLRLDDDTSIRLDRIVTVRRADSGA
jgi:Rho-binding antiterminator